MDLRVASALLLLLPLVASAQDYPAKPVRIVVPYSAGGNADILGRTLAQKLGDALKQPFVVENHAGANGGIGTDFVAKSVPDGYTLLVTASGPITVNPTLYKSVPYDALKDFAPISECAVYQYVLVTLATSPWKTIADIVAAARAKPGAVSYGSTGVGGGNHLSGELFALATGSQLTHVPYKGSAPALADLLGGQLSMMFDTVITSVPQIRAGKLRAFAVSSGKRASSLPDVPTMQESGYPGVGTIAWQALFAPGAVPKEVLDALFKATVQALQAPPVVDAFPKHNFNIVPSKSLDDAKAWLAGEIKSWKDITSSVKIGTAE